MSAQLTENINQNTKSHFQRIDWVICAIILAVAIIIRLDHFFIIPLDRLDESYHRWLISFLTLERGGYYTDLKLMPNFTIVWLPLFQYLTTSIMMFSKNLLIDVSRLLSLVAGAVTCIITYMICVKIYDRKWLGLVGGLILAFQPWHINYSTLGTPEILLGLVTSLSVYFLIADKNKFFSIFLALMMLTSYEGWLIVAFLLLLAWKHKHWSKNKLTFPIVTILAIVIIWCLWSFMNTGNPIGWAQTYLNSIGWTPQFKDPSGRIIFYTNEMLKMTFFLTALGLFFGIILGKEPRAISVLIISYIAIYSVAAVFGVDLGYEGRLVPLIPLTALTIPAAFPRFPSKFGKRLLVCTYLLLLLLVPYFSLMWIFPQKTYVISPAYRSGLWIEENVSGSGLILSDFPSIIYFSSYTPDRFLSYDHLSWYLKDPNAIKLGVWLKQHNIQYIVLEKVPYSIGWKVFSNLLKEEGIVIIPSESLEYGEAKLRLVYEDSLRIHLVSPTFWEHDPAFGDPRVPDVLIYEVSYEPS